VTDPISFLEKKISGLSIDHYEIYLVESQHLSLQSKENALESSEDGRERGVAIRLFKKGRVAFACSSDFDPKFLEQSLKHAYESLALLSVEEPFSLPFLVSSNIPFVATPLSQTPLAQKMEIVLNLERAARAYDRRIQRVRDVRYSEENKHVILKNSEGFMRDARQSRYELSMMAVAEEAGSQEMAWDNGFALCFENLCPEDIGQRVAEKAVSQLHAAPIKTQKTPVVLDALVSASLLSVLASSFFGDQVQKNRSLLKDKLGKTIYSEKISLVDDGNLATPLGLGSGYGNFPFDDEGVDSLRNVLVERGTIRQFLYDSHSAAQAGKKSTGNAVRPHYKEAPRIGARNFFIEPGKAELKDMILEMGCGFWVRDVIGLHTADPVSGDFSLGATGIWIDGSQRQPVRGVTLSGNLHDIFKKVDKVGSEVWFQHSYGAPPLLIQSMDIGGL